MAETQEIQVVKGCSVCEHPDREGIETLGLISCATWNICAKRINNAFNTAFSSKTVQKHMEQHRLHQTSIEAGVLLDGLSGGAKISPKNMLQTLLIQGMLDLAKGKIRCKTPAELLNVINMMMTIQKNEEMQTAAIEGLDLGAVYAVMGAYGEAVKDSVSPQQLKEIVAKATALGARINITNIDYAVPQDLNGKDIMSLAMNDYRNLGRPRTREELEQDPEWINFYDKNKQMVEVVVNQYDGLQTPNMD